MSNQRRDTHTQSILVLCHAGLSAVLYSTTIALVALRSGSGRSRADARALLDGRATRDDSLIL
jgi:hypothetical protein